MSATVVSNTDAKTLQGFVGERAAKGATVYTDDHGGYQGMPFEHETVKHSVSEYVSGMAHTNGIESFWAMFKRGYHGTYHHMSEKHLGRYVTEFSGRHNVRQADTINQMEDVVASMVGKRADVSGSDRRLIVNDYRLLRTTENLGQAVGQIVLWLSGEDVPLALSQLQSPTCRHFETRFLSQRRTCGGCSQIALCNLERGPTQYAQ